jgi:upstream activation factor subunit UAF30
MPFKKKATKKAAKPNSWPKKSSPAKKAAKKAVAKKAAKKSVSKATASKTGFNAPIAASQALAEVVGSKPMPRTEIIKKIWEYIKKNNLQDASNRRMINADAKLKTLFGGKSQVSMFDLAKIVSKNVK